MLNLMAERIYLNETASPEIGNDVQFRRARTHNRGAMISD
jgi:hypothetical protein